MKPLSDKQQSFVNEYCINGHNASQAYKRAYPNSKGEWEKLGPRLRVKEGVKDAIAKIMAKTAEKTETTLETLQTMYSKAYDLAKETKQPAAMVTATTGIARLYGFDKDNDMRGDQARELEESEKVAADKMAELWRNNMVKAG